VRPGRDRTHPGRIGAPSSRFRLIFFSALSECPQNLTLKGRLPREPELKPLSSIAQPAERAATPTFEGLYEECFEFTWRVLRNLSVHPNALEDAAQEVWTVVHRGLSSFEGRSSVRTWLFGIALNIARRQRRLESKHRSLELLPERLPSSAPDPELHRSARETYLLLSRFLDALDEQDRAIFVSNLIEDLSASETAEAVGVKVAIVYQRVRTLRRLAKDWLLLHEQGKPE
jgi:RNA polymerase sigma-70 factor (ECF subfamily)